MLYPDLKSERGFNKKNKCVTIFNYSMNPLRIVKTVKICFKKSILLMHYTMHSMTASHKRNEMMAAATSCSYRGRIAVFLLIASICSLSLRLSSEAMKKVTNIFHGRNIYTTSRYCLSRYSLHIGGTLGFSRNYLQRRSLGSTAESKSTTVKVSPSRFTLSSHIYIIYFFKRTQTLLSL